MASIQPSSGERGLAPDIAVPLTLAQQRAVRRYWADVDVVRRAGQPAPKPVPDPQLERALAAARAKLAAGGK